MIIVQILEVGEEGRFGDQVGDVRLVAYKLLAKLHTKGWTPKIDAQEPDRKTKLWSSTNWGWIDYNEVRGRIVEDTEWTLLEGI